MSDDKMTQEPRLTTAEAAKQLNCKKGLAAQLLRAANVPFSRSGVGKHGPYLWQRSGVNRLIAALTAGKEAV